MLAHESPCFIRTVTCCSSCCPQDGLCLPAHELTVSHHTAGSLAASMCRNSRMVAATGLALLTGITGAPTQGAAGVRGAAASPGTGLAGAGRPAQTESVTRDLQSAAGTERTEAGSAVGTGAALTAAGAGARGMTGKTSTMERPGEEPAAQIAALGATSGGDGPARRQSVARALPCTPPPRAAQSLAACRGDRTAVVACTAGALPRSLHSTAAHSLRGNKTAWRVGTAGALHCSPPSRAAQSLWRELGVAPASRTTASSSVRGGPPWAAPCTAGRVCEMGLGSLERLWMHITGQQRAPLASRRSRRGHRWQRSGHVMGLATLERPLKHSRAQQRAPLASRLSGGRQTG